MPMVFQVSETLRSASITLVDPTGDTTIDTTIVLEVEPMDTENGRRYELTQILRSTTANEVNKRGCSTRWRRKIT